MTRLLDQQPRKLTQTVRTAKKLCDAVTDFDHLVMQMQTQQHDDPSPASTPSV